MCWGLPLRLMTMMGIKALQSKLTAPTPILPLVIFRMAFGLLMCFSQLRFMWKGWIEDCFVSPSFHFTYQYFSWVEAFSAPTMYIIVGASALFALFIGLGLFYRASSILFFLSFTYLELIEKSWYLNHYYFVSLVAFVLIWLPAHRNLSLDAFLFKGIRLSKVPMWTVLVPKLQLAMVYFFGGMAKLKSDWLFEAQPLKIWLQARTDLPIIGSLFEYDGTAFAFSWAGMLFDLTIPFLLWNRRTRPWAYVLVAVFHVLTYILFNIGMFPWLMIAGSLVFISADEWKNLFGKFGLSLWELTENGNPFKTRKMALPLLLTYLIFQLALPLRHFALTDNVLWTENGFRFAWHVMVMEKNGFAEFSILDNQTQKVFTVYPSKYLSVVQEKQMSFQPDMIWQFAQYLNETYDANNEKDLSIYVNSKVSLNGRASQTYIDPKVDLLKVASIDAIYGCVVGLSDSGRTH